jgi:hypothetical protein
MSQENINKSRSEATSPHRGFAMVMAVAIAVPLLYVLSIGPAEVICMKHPKCGSTLHVFYLPVNWLYFHTAFGKPLDWYIRLWVD